MSTEAAPEVPEHRNPEKCRAMAKALRGCQDPLSAAADKTKLAVKEVNAVFEPDSRGLVEVLFRNNDGEALTAFMRGTQLAYIVEGW